METTRLLIVNADDFGQSAGVNRGVIACHEGGLVTSASLMVRWPAAAAAAAYGRTHSSLSLGLHLDLGEWAYRDDHWVALYQVVASEDAAAVAAELERQLTAFRELVGREPTHLDSHQHVHLREPVRSALVVAARRLGVPLRHFSPAIRYCGDFYGQERTGTPLPEAIGPESLIGILRRLPPGATELGCHPGLDDDLDSAYRCERGVEVAALCDPRMAKALAEAGVELCSFHRFRGTDVAV
jgi:predicted glycoside hydrolase/deacetylase ChbG (UPF0249 family)